MNQNPKEFFVQFVLQELRIGRIPPPGICVELNTFEFIDTIRGFLGSDDVPWLTLQLSRLTDAQLDLVINLTMPVAKNAEIKEALLALWHSGVRSVHLIYGILNIEGIHTDYHEESFHFLRDNWDSYLAHETHYNTGAADALEVVEKRLQNKSIPQSKVWLYWCSAFLSEQHARRAAFFASLDTLDPSLDLHMNDFRKKVHEFLVSRAALK